MTLSELFILSIYVAAFYLIAAPVSLWLMQFLMPKDLVQRYWRPPHFRESEVAVFSGPVLGLMKTVMLLSLIGLPRLGRRRNAQDAHKMAPGWYKWTARGVLAAICGVPLLFVLVMMALHWHSAA